MSARILIKTSKTQPPSFKGFAYFERSCDPFHPRKIQSALDKTIDSSDIPESGWMGIDWFENPIGFIPDGTGYETLNDSFSIEEGYFSDGRMFAYPNSEHGDDLKARHRLEKQKRVAQKPSFQLKPDAKNSLLKRVYSELKHVFVSVVRTIRAMCEIFRLPF